MGVLKHIIFRSFAVNCMKTKDFGRSWSPPPLRVVQINCYRSQPSWAKVMFLHVSVILFTGGLPHCMLGYPPTPSGTRSRHPTRTRGRHTPLGPGTSPRIPPEASTTPPSAPVQCMQGDTSNAAGSTHPTGMRSCIAYYVSQGHTGL